MAQLFYGSIQREGVRIQYYRTGGEKPPVIMLHGLADNGLCWNRIPVLLEVEYDVVLMDARGHGMSGLDERGAGVSVQADDVNELITQLNLIHPVLIGHSMGAALAALVAARLPKIVRGVVFIDPPWREENAAAPTNGKRPPGEDLQAAYRKNKVTDLETLIARGRLENPGWDESEFPQWAKSKQQFNPEALKTIWSQDYPWSEVVARLACPGLLITGDPEQGAIVTPVVAERVKKLWRKGRVLHVPAAGHSIHRDQFRPVMNAIYDFLRSLGRWSAK
jgi:pimeloyl-ACP methyl ester carboxylesterase